MKSTNLSSARRLLWAVVLSLVGVGTSGAQVHSTQQPQHSAGPATAPLEFSAVRLRLQSALNAMPHASTRASVCVMELNSNATVFERGSDSALIPASVMKLFVMIASIAHLGPDFSFETVLGIDGGNIVVVGGGDPGFGDEKLHAGRDESITSDFVRWATLLKQPGVPRIPRDLIIDESIFDNQWLHPSWEEKDLDNWYAAPVGGLNFNDNCVDITLRPQSDGKVEVEFQPNNSLVRIVGRCRVGKGPPVLHHPHDSFEYRISGSCAKRWPFGSVSFPDPGMLFADSLKTTLMRNHIALSGKIVRRRVRLDTGELPASLRVLDRHRTSISQILARIGKDSQNLFAECLLKRLGYEWSKQIGSPTAQGSWKTGQDAIMNLVRKVGIDTKDLRLSDGSGLSRENRCTARQLVDLLAWMHRQPNAWLLYDALAVAGEPGSLNKRLGDVPRRVFAKTGTMTGVTALAGYVLGYDGSQYAFCVMFNGYPGSSAPYRKIQDTLCRVLVGDS